MGRKILATNGNRWNNQDETMLIPDGAATRVDIPAAFSSRFGYAPNYLSLVYVDCYLGAVKITGNWPGAPSFERELRSSDPPMIISWSADPIDLPAGAELLISNETLDLYGGTSSSSSAPLPDAEVGVTFIGVDHT